MGINQVRTTGEVNVFHDNKNAAKRILAAVESGEATATPLQITQMREALAGKISTIVELPCQGLCGGACKEKCINGLY